MSTLRPPESYLHGVNGPCVVLPARVCAYLESRAGLEEFRRTTRGVDAEVDAVLVAISVAARNWRSSATGTPHAAPPELEPQSQWLSTSQAANILGITSRGVRKAIHENRLEASPIGKTWRIRREDIKQFQGKPK